MCTLCGQRGIIDTRGVKTPAGVEVGRLNWCLCPNGQAMREQSGDRLPADFPEYTQLMCPEHQIAFDAWKRRNGLTDAALNWSAGLNAFGLQLFVESIADKKDAKDFRPISFVYRGIRVTLEPESGEEIDTRHH